MKISEPQLLDKKSMSERTAEADKSWVGSCFVEFYASLTDRNWEKTG